MSQEKQKSLKIITREEKLEKLETNILHRTRNLLLNWYCTKLMLLSFSLVVCMFRVKLSNSASVILFKLCLLQPSVITKIIVCYRDAELKRIYKVLLCT